MSKSAGLRWMLPRAADGVILLCPPCLYLMVLVVATQRGGMGFDFHVFWEASRAVAHGQSPYDPEGLAEMRRVAQADLSVPFPNTAWAVYPPALYTLLVPLGLLPWPAAAALGMTLLAVTPALALRVMGVRDWRCYCLAYGSPPIFTSVVLGTISTALMLGFALVWRGRGVLVAGGSTVVAKLFLWPVAIAVAVSDGSRRALTLLAAAAACAVGSWAVIGFEDIDRYPQMLSDLSAAEAHNSFSTTGFAFALGLPLKVGVYVGLALGVTVIAFAFRAGLRGRRDAAFSLMLVAALQQRG